MNTETPPPNRLWNLEGWGLRWKVAAVLAVPLTVAVVLGGLRVQNEVSQALEFRNQAKQVADIPEIVDLGTIFGTVSAGYATKTVTNEDIVAMEKAIVAAKAATFNPSFPGSVTEKLQNALVGIEKIRDDVNNGVNDPELPAKTAAIRADMTDIVDEVILPIDDAEVLNAHDRLVGVWAAQRRLADQVTAALDVLKNPNAPLNALYAAAGAERAMIDVLARSYPDADAQIQELRDRNRARVDIIDGAVGGPLPLLELRASMLESVKIYGTMLEESTHTIASTVAEREQETTSAAIRDSLVVLGTLIAATVLGLLVARSLINPIRRLRRGALQVANHDLPDAIDRIKDGDDTGVMEFDPVPVQTTEEIGQLARAVDDIHGQALRLAGEQAHLRLRIADMFETLARRSKSLVDQQLGLIENLEFEEKDPKRLESLFRLDHLAARMRRNGENLLILSGTRTRRGHSAPVQVGDVVRAAMSEVEDYQRVEVKATPQGAISGAVATDIVHLLAELLDNSLRASPPDSKVTFNFSRAVDGGLLLEITDRGIGIPAAEMAVINDRLASGGEVSPETARHMGLFVASRLADQHGLTVRMRPTFDTVRNQGVTVSVHIPHTALVSSMTMGMTGPQGRVDSDGYPVTGEQAAVAEPSVPVTVTVGPGPLTTGPIGLPQRTPAEPNGLPQRTPAEPNGLPQRAPVEPNGLPRRTPAMLGVLPQRAPVEPEGLPQRGPSAPSPSPQPSPLAPPAGLPQRTPGASGLPQRTPGATTGLPQLNPEVSTPVPAPAPAAPTLESAPAAPAAPAAKPESVEAAGTTQHRYRVNSQKTASFFQPRANVEPLRPILHPQETTPIFSGMVSDWLTTPTPGEGNKNWTSAADEGWNAAERASAPRVEARTESGLPQRQPGHQLVPGGVDGADKITVKLRDPEAIREKLSRHQKGIRDGRAAGHAERNSI
ncbi:HAMP domain protein [Rhodococcus sp. MTM3W5.2]|uniref:ATP-binding protein n=1 Tax=Rhodococcus sp. MTM3W5.2 TaxID=1805827 RepID=UPI0009791776|nr:ATP-binding protein [Rhodococcus sp. MTM3W5.2]AQA25689.1 HAMP domain protein [Rhodococcus sp. MTM3W5.2]